MSAALLQSLIGGEGSGGQIVGGLVIAVLYATIGLLAAAGSILVFQRVFRGRWEPIFWAGYLVMIAAFYLSFAAYFGAAAPAWRTELIAFAVFFVCAVAGLVLRPAIALGYFAHGIWDLSHGVSGLPLAGLSMTEIPLGYDLFCLAFDLVVAVYLLTSKAAWHEPGRFDPYFWRRRR